MKALNRVGRKLSPGARLAYAIAGATLLVLPAVVVSNEGDAGVAVWLVVSALFGTGYLIAAVLGGRIRSDGAGSTAGR